MNRRQFLGLGVGAVVAVTAPAVARATPLKAKRVATRVFESDELEFDTSVYWHDDGKHAFTAQTKDLVKQIASVDDPTSTARVKNLRDVTKDAPKVGDERKAVAFTLESPLMVIDFHVLIVRQGNLVYVFNTMSAAGVSTALATTVNETAKRLFKRVAKPSTSYTDKALLDRLPRQDEVPSALKVTDEKVGEDDTTT